MGIRLCLRCLRCFPTPWAVVALLCPLAYVLWLVIWGVIADLDTPCSPGWAVLGCGEFVAGALGAGQTGLAGVRRCLRPVVRALRAVAQALRVFKRVLRRCSRR